MVDQLPGLRSGSGHAGPVDDVVEAQLQVLEHALTRHALATVGLGVDPTELLFRQAICEASLLFLLELYQILGRVPPTSGPAVLTGRVRAFVQCHDLALGAEDVGTEATGDPGSRAGVAGHVRPSVAWAADNRCGELGCRL